MVGGQQPLVFTLARHGQSAASCLGVCAFRATFAFAISFHLAESFGQRCVQFVVAKLARANWSSEPCASASRFGERPGAAEDDELPWSPGASVPCGFFLQGRLQIVEVCMLQVLLLRNVFVRRINLCE